MERVDLMCYSSEETSDSEKSIEKNTKSIFSDLSLKKMIRKHKGYITTLCLLKDGRLASSSEDKEIIIHDLSLGTSVTLLGHSRTISYLTQLENGILISSSYDKTIKIWEQTGNTFSCIKTLTHNDCVLKIISINNNRLCSCSSDKSLKIWNSNSPYQCYKILYGHYDEVNSVIQLKSHDYIVSSAIDSTLIFWDSTTFEQKKIVYDVTCCDSNSLLEIDGKIFVGSNNEIIIVDPTTAQVQARIQNEEMGFANCIVEWNGKILYGSEQGDLICYDRKTLCKVWEKEDLHNWRITSIIPLSNCSFITASFDKTIKIWELDSLSK